MRHWLCAWIFVSGCIYAFLRPFVPEGSVNQGLNNSLAVITYTCKHTLGALLGDYAVLWSHRPNLKVWRISLLLSHLQRFNVTRTFSEAISVYCRGLWAKIHIKKNFNKAWQIYCINSADIVKQDLYRSMTYWNFF